MRIAILYYTTTTGIPGTVLYSTCTHTVHHTYMYTYIHVQEYCNSVVMYSTTGSSECCNTKYSTVRYIHTYMHTYCNRGGLTQVLYVHYRTVFLIYIIQGNKNHVGLSVLHEHKHCIRNYCSII